MKKLFSLISVFALAMGAMAETQSVTLTITESTTVTDNKVSQNGIVLSNVGRIEIIPEDDGDVWLVANGESMVVSLADGYDITKIVITPQPGYEGDFNHDTSASVLKAGDGGIVRVRVLRYPRGGHLLRRLYRYRRNGLLLLREPYCKGVCHHHKRNSP